MDEEYKKQAHERWLRRQRRGSVDEEDLPFTAQLPTTTTTIHTSAPLTACSASSSVAASSSSMIAPAPSSPTAASSSASFSLSTSGLQTQSSSSPSVSDISSSTRSNVHESHDPVSNSKYVDTSGDLELARKFEQEEKQFIEQTRRDEDLARQMQENIDRDEEIARRMAEEEEQDQSLAQQMRNVHEVADSDDEEQQHVWHREIHRGLGLPPSARAGPPFGGREDFEELFRLMGLGAVPGSDVEAGGGSNRRRVQFASFDDYIRSQIEEAGEGEEYHGGVSPEVLRQMPTRTYIKPTGTSSADQQNCSICLSEFVEGDKLRSLPCFHWFHESEIDQWLAMNNSCPICKTVVKV